MSQISIFFFKKQRNYFISNPWQLLLGTLKVKNRERFSEGLWILAEGLWLQKHLMLWMLTLINLLLCSILPLNLSFWILAKRNFLLKIFLFPKKNVWLSIHHVYIQRYFRECTIMHCYVQIQELHPVVLPGWNRILLDWRMFYQI